MSEKDGKENLEMIRFDEVERKTVLLEGRQEMDLIYMSVKVPPDMLYKTGKGTAGILSPFYDLCARVIGISFSCPEVTEITEEKIKIKVEGIYFNQNGMRIKEGITYIYDARKLYNIERQRWSVPKKWDERAGRYIDDTGRIERLKKEGFLLDDIVYDEETFEVKMIKRKLPPEIEKHLWDNFQMKLQSMVQRASTNGRRIITQRAIGNKGVKFDDKDLKWKDKARILIYGFKPIISHDQGLKSVNAIFGQMPVDDDSEGELENGVLEPSFDEEVKGAPPAQEVKGAPPAQEVKGAPPAQEVKGAPLAQEVKGAPPAQEVKGAPPVRGASFQTQGGIPCKGCKKPVSNPRVIKFSLDNYGMELCYDCQKIEKAKQEKTKIK